MSFGILLNSKSTCWLSQFYTAVFSTFLNNTKEISTMLFYFVLSRYDERKDRERFLFVVVVNIYNNNNNNELSSKKRRKIERKRKINNNKKK